ncbi:histidine phosphatase family protein [Bacillus sp. FJAT-45350]|uniref:histidine phosphatase family protein n=1 Tax=Bacillus sp. FJAT-45350 TaxID=2011014 RepID=UPI000BB7BB28|nr:histidine phosphatase family protein [Bacillus sp. FJAT-45350]
MANSVAITLIRHGLTKSNQEKRYLGWTDELLCLKGRKELEMLIQNNYPVGELLITSDLKRCQETAEILYPGQSIETSTFFRECHFGDWEKKTYEELKNDSAYRKWINNPIHVQPPNGESLEQFQQRIELGWKRLISLVEMKQITSVVIICHGGTIRTLLEKYAPKSKGFWNWSVGFGCGYTLICEREHLRRGMRCTSLQVAPSTEKGSG